MKKKIILDLCGGTGSWSKPYSEDPNFEVRVIDPKANGLDVRLFRHPEEEIYGVLAAPPCTDFSVSGAQYWESKGKVRLLEALSIADACFRIIAVTKPKFWALENPVGRLRHYLGDPQLIFNPCDYGDPYTKKTLLWGSFNQPVKNPVEPIRACTQGSWLQKLGGKSERTKTLRSMTPQGFAKAFYEANR